MWGSIIGDLAGSIYEYEQSKEISSVTVNKIIENNAFYSDDTIMTVALVDAIMNDKKIRHDRKYNYYLRDYALKYHNYLPDFKPYFPSAFSRDFNLWICGDRLNNSSGNEALTRISPVGFMFDSEEKVEYEAMWSTGDSHNTLEAKKDAALIALIIYYFRNGLTKEAVIDKLKLKLKYVPFEKFNKTCMDTMDNVLYAVFTSNSFEDAIRTIISYGGNTDANAAIVGGMAEALYGVDSSLIKQAKEKIPDEFTKVLEKSYSIIRR